ncbi:hypothetical protein GCM10020358_59010 [Amorphoplanes nipponensis]|uniref:DUF397 domain-containing protein n=1 Tax=Actinoplanes nipponensis TaxID=135950 RepID=A0A919MIX7_9ACTN|nr:DUF397 domain-containing protein [Actinoplanes nipponensis]GIE46881.1 hypothetical protein Ani05nite_04150 [Actinoplanes nipponensis]
MADQGLTPQWRTSARSSGGACVEVQTRPDVVLIRDSKDREGGVLSFDRATFGEFLGALKSDRLDPS